MGTGIIVCGLNGSGKSTLGKALANKLHFHFIDIEDLFFSKEDPQYRYASPRTKEEAERLLWNAITAHENFVFAAVKGDYGERVCPFFTYAVRIDAPKDVRMRRVKRRSFQKFGKRMQRGGDLYEAEERFFAFAASRSETLVDDWLESLNCPVLRHRAECGFYCRANPRTHRALPLTSRGRQRRLNRTPLCFRSPGLYFLHLSYALFCRVCTNLFVVIPTAWEIRAARGFPLCEGARRTEGLAARGIRAAS